MQSIDTDYLVVGAGAMGMAFTDALVDHADVHVTLVDRRHGAGGHWWDAYPFVQLHQASQFYGVASTLLGSGEIQTRGPEAGLHERARKPEILAYYDDVLRRLVGSGRVTFLGGWDHRRDGAAHVLVSRISGERRAVDGRARVVDATYLAPTVPATSPPPFGVADDARVVPIGELAEIDDAPTCFVIVGSGKTATDGIVWLIGNGVDPDRICWIRPRDPWMLDRAVVQPDPAIALSASADILSAAAEATSLDDLFLRLEAAGVMLRVDPAVTPTMARTPTLGRWELEVLRSVERVVRAGHVEHVTSDEVVLRDERIRLDAGAVVVHCAASGLRNPPMVPIWQPDAIRLQTIRAGFPCFCAALAGYVEATRDDDGERNRLCPPNLYGNSLAEWARMQARGADATAAFGSEPDVAAWAGGCALNPSRTTADQRERPDVRAAAERLAAVAPMGRKRLTSLGAA